MLTIESLALQGRYNPDKSGASALAARVLEIVNRKLEAGSWKLEGGSRKAEFLISNFQLPFNVEHRLEYVNNIHGIEFINDSKATNVNSTWWALESMTKPVIWIAGGQDKCCNYAMVQEIVKKKVKAIVCIGLDNKKIIKAFSNDIKMIVETRSMAEALKYSYQIAEPGDVVLLSPACSSYDLFEDYEDRGRQFKKLVKEF